MTPLSGCLLTSSALERSEIDPAPAHSFASPQHPHSVFTQHSLKRTTQYDAMSPDRKPNKANAAPKDERNTADCMAVYHTLRTVSGSGVPIDSVADQRVTQTFPNRTTKAKTTAGLRRVLAAAQAKVEQAHARLAEAERAQQALAAADARPVVAPTGRQTRCALSGRFRQRALPSRRTRRSGS